MQHRIFSSIVALALLALVAAPATSSADMFPPGPHLIQNKRLVASSQVHTWVSRRVPPKALVRIHIYRRGKALRQRIVSGCSANYLGGGLLVRAVITNCKPSRASRSRVVLRFVSITRKQPFAVRLSF